jgi:hypothetical protein
MFKKILIILSFAVAIASCIGYTQDITTSPEQKFLNDINNYEHASDYNMFNNERIIFYGKKLCKSLDKYPPYDALVTFVWDHQDINSVLTSAIVASATINFCPQYKDAVDQVLYEYNIPAML